MPVGNQLSSIQHIVVLMLENRSFDHMLGFLYTDEGNKSPSGQPFEGLTGKESNPDSTGKSVTVFKIKPTDKNAYFMPGADPGEGYNATNSELFGNINAPTPPVATNQGFLKDFSYTLGWEEKSPSWAKGILPGTVAQNIMGMFTPKMLPVLSGLARGYAVCDQWYCSLPTETMPNRAFANAATSQGHMDDLTKSFTVPSIFGLLGQHNVSWAIYGYDSEPLTRLNFPDTTSADDSHFGLFKDFQAAAAGGTLPAYTFLEPSWSSTGNSQHPNYDVALGEQLIHDVYYALYNGKAWNQTLLVITYDEHGGCYDHVPPPQGAVPPDSTPGEYGFDFKRFGIRVPAVLVSPLIEAGIVFRVPEGETPLDHTSILKTVEKRWGVPALTARDAAAPDLGDVLTHATPRTDDPLKGVKVPPPSGKDPAKGRPSHLEQIHAELVSRLPVQEKQAKKLPHISELRTSADHKAYIKARTAAWKASRKTTAASNGQSPREGAAKKPAHATKKAKKKS
ncbi:MAG TPA: alkaline phosphatase family protein [Pyrinomonadaceae bacterium]|jgi:phospholipase C